MALAPGTRIGRYEVTAQLGVGGMGEVYQATDVNLKRQVALKVLPESVSQDAVRLARFQREAETLASLNHPNIAAIYGFEGADGHRALAMELVEGPTLAERLQHGPIPLGDALRIARQIAEALEAAHERGIVHRDLKPANVKLRPDGVVKVLDFGVAKALDPRSTTSPSASMAPTVTTPTVLGTILGTPAYMSPEQARGRAVDRRTDVWAFGAVLFEMLAGTRPFPGDDVSQTLARVIEREPDWSLLPAATPAYVRRAIALCLQKDPKQRIGDLSAIRLALDGAFESGPWHDRTTPARSAHVVPALAAAAAALAGAALATFWWMPGREPSAAVGPTRFVITTPADRPVLDTTGVSQVAISPDGTRVAYGTAAGQGNANLQVYVRALGDLEAVPLRGTEGGGTSPFFSPDGQSIGFLDADDNALKRVPVQGGLAQTIATLDAGPVGMEWAPDDTILFSLTGGGGLLRVPAAGGDPVSVTMPDPASGDTAHAFPDLLPDGRHALFSIQGKAGWRLAVAALDTGAVTDLKLAGSDPSYSSTGHIVYSGSDGSLSAIGFDAGRRTLTGRTPVTIVEDVNTRPNGVANVDLAANGSGVYVSGTGEVALRTLAWVDRQGREEPLGLPPRLYTNPRVSPDGTRVVMSFDGDIWITELARPGTLQRVTSDPARERFPLWTPSGDRIVFESNSSGTLALYARAADGRGDAEPIFANGPKTWTILSPEAWSADGREILFAYTSSGLTNLDIGVVPFDGSRPWRPLLDTPASEANVVVSRDGRLIAYEANDTGEVEVYVESYPMLGGRQILSTGGAKNPFWSRDGREVFYRRGVGVDGTMMASAIRTSPTFSMGPGRALFGGNFYYAAVGSRSWDVAPGGRFLMMREVERTEADRPRIVYVQNWSEDLRRLAPSN